MDQVLLDQTEQQVLMEVMALVLETETQDKQVLLALLAVAVMLVTLVCQEMMVQDILQEILPMLLLQEILALTEMMVTQEQAAQTALVQQMVALVVLVLQELMGQMEQMEMLAQQDLMAWVLGQVIQD